MPENIALSKRNISIALIVVVVTFAGGRFSVPQKIKIETKVVEIEKKNSDIKTTVANNTKTKRTKVETIKPDGTKEITTTIIVDNKDKTDTDTSTFDDIRQKDDTVSTKTSMAGKISVQILAASNLTNITGTPSFGASVSANVIGPVRVGVFGLSNGTSGLSCGLDF